MTARPGSSGRRVAGTALAFVAVLAVCSAFTPPAAAVLVDRVVASVNNEVIALSDLRRAVAFNREAGGAANGRRLAIETLEGLINRKLLLQEAYRLRFAEVSQKDISGELDRLRQRFGSPAAYREFLVRTGIAEAQLSRMIGERLLVERFVERKIELYARVGREDVQAYYDGNPGEFQGRRFSEVQQQITALLVRRMAAQQLDGYIAELRKRAEIRVNPIRDEDGF